MGAHAKLLGQKFNKLLVLEEIPERKNGSVVWKCLCDCGNITTATSTDLTKGYKKSCGCLIVELIHKNFFKDLTGQQFGELTVLEKSESNNRHTYWECLCACGNQKSIRSDSLTCGLVASCGCKNKQTHGETLIATLLKNNNIPFKQEYSAFKLSSGRPVRFDFYVKDQYFIEFDGEQHYKSIKIFDGDEGLKSTQERDRKKNEYCINNNIPLIRIPYYHVKDLCLDDLIPETSNFLIKEK